MATETTRWEDARDWALLIGKTMLFVLGGILVLAALVEGIVTGTWFRRGETWLDTFEKSAALVLLAGLLLALPPLALTFRDALRSARKGRARE